MHLDARCGVKMSDKSRAFVNQTFIVAFAAILQERDIRNVRRISDRGNLSVSVYSLHIVGEVGHASSTTAATQEFQ